MAPPGRAGDAGVLALTLLALPVIASCDLGLPGGQPGQSVQQQLSAFQASIAPRLSGSVEGQGTALGQFRFTPTRCQSGARLYFLGADLLEQSSGRFVRVTLDPTQGPALLVGQQGNTGALRLIRDNCSRIEVTVEPQSVRINRVQLMSGRARFQCQPKSGGTVEGEVTFSNCP
jgi:hypothetical protein